MPAPQPPWLAGLCSASPVPPHWAGRCAEDLVALLGQKARRDSLPERVPPRGYEPLGGALGSFIAIDPEASVPPHLHCGLEICVQWP